VIGTTTRRFPDAVQRETLHRRSGIVPYSECVKVPVRRRSMLRCTRDMHTLHAYNAATALTSIKNSSRTRRSMIKSVFGG
jgi:hypothetical protein